jgi:hypothetical protein
MNATAQLPYRPHGAQPSAKQVYLIVLVLAALLYLATSQRGVSWQDSGMFQYRAFRGDLTGHMGLALAHPLYIAAGWCLKSIPFWRFTSWLNFFSGVGMAVALANLSAVVLLLTGRRWIAFAVAAMTAVSHTPWWLATIAEVYTWSLAGFTAELWLLVLLIRWPTTGKLAALALVSGLGLCVHNFALLPLPVYVVAAIVLIARRRLPAWSLAVAAGAWIAGAGLYLGLIAAEIARGASVLATVRSALFGVAYRDEVLNAGLAWDGVRRFNLAVMVANVLGPQLLCVVSALWLRRAAGKPLAAALGAIVAIQLLFVVRYNVPDQFTFFLPALVMINILAAVGMAHLSARSSRAAWVLGGLVAAWIVASSLVLMAAPRLIDAAGINIDRQRQLPFRNEARYWLVPWKRTERSAEYFASSVFHGKPEAPAPGHAIIVADPTAFYPLALAQRLDRARAELLIVGGHEPWPIPHPDRDLDGFWAAVGDRPLYVVSPIAGYCPKALLESARFQQEGLLWRATRLSAGPQPGG